MRNPTRTVEWVRSELLALTSEMGLKEFIEEVNRENKGAVHLGYTGVHNFAIRKSRSMSYERMEVIRQALVKRVAA